MRPTPSCMPFLCTISLSVSSNHTTCEGMCAPRHITLLLAVGTQIKHRSSEWTSHSSVARSSHGPTWNTRGIILLLQVLLYGKSIVRTPNLEKRTAANIRGTARQRHSLALRYNKADWSDFPRDNSTREERASTVKTNRKIYRP